MAIENPCSLGCGRWARPKSDVCETCAANRSVHKRNRPAQRMAYRQRLALATRRQTTYAEEFGDKLEVEPIELDKPMRRKAKVIAIGPHIKRRKAASARARRRA